MSDLKDKINKRMDVLQSMMESNFHLKDPKAVNLQIDSVSKFWSVLSDEDKDYIHCSRDALTEQTEWKI